MSKSWHPVLPQITDPDMVSKHDDSHKVDYQQEYYPGQKSNFFHEHKFAIIIAVVILLITIIIIYVFIIKNSKKVPVKKDDNRKQLDHANIDEINKMHMYQRPMMPTPPIQSMSVVRQPMPQKPVLVQEVTEEKEKEKEKGDPTEGDENNKENNEGNNEENNREIQSNTAEQSNDDDY
jgi:hypothetical protein